MTKSELLSPAGSYESAIAAMQNGCDALYLGGMRFGARAFAHNFDEAMLSKVIKEAHAYGVKVYITVNTLIHEDELEACYEYIHMLYTLGADAMIVQDLGILHYVRSNYPDFEVHSSTQMHTCNKEALLFLKQKGVKRAVLPRETTIEEIKQFTKLGIEIEVFVHGALCVSYSGQCLFSYMVGGRSGNRGECAQSCRMPYTLCDYDTKKEYSKSAYILSLKDLNTIEHVQELIDANVASFKIEGRMKKSEYVGHITSIYRKAMDLKDYKVSEKDLHKAKVLFHRGYSDGWMYHKKGSALYNPHRPNHIGIEVGKVLFTKNGNIRVKLFEDLNQGDGVRILMEEEDFGFKVNRIYKNGLLVNKGLKNDVVDIECHSFVKANSTLLKTSDIQVEKEIRTHYESIQRRVKVDMQLYASADAPMYLTISDGTHSICVYSEQDIMQATNKPATIEDVKMRLSKINNTIFSVGEMDITLDGNLFIPVKMLNDLRREAVEALYKARSEAVDRKYVPYEKVDRKPLNNASMLCAKVKNEVQLCTCLQYPFHKIYVEDKDVYNAYKNHANVYYVSSRVAKNGYEDAEMISELGGVSLSGFDVDTSLNVCNSENAYFLYTNGANKICVSWEMSLLDTIEIADKLKQKYQIEHLLERVVYGRCEVMVSKHCPINACLLDNDKQNCQLCRKKTYALKDKFNNVYPMKNDQNCNMRLYDYKIRNEIASLKEHLNNGISCRFDFTFEDEKEIKNILNTVFK